MVNVGTMVFDVLWEWISNSINDVPRDATHSSVLSKVKNTKIIRLSNKHTRSCSCNRRSTNATTVSSRT